MRKSRTPGSVRGVSGNGYPYRDRFIKRSDQYRFQLSIRNTEEETSHLLASDIGFT